MTSPLPTHAPESSFAHTPGPWRFETVRTSCGLVHKIGPFPWKEGKPSNACIYVDYPGRGAVETELLANARLIAAAPDLLDVCQSLEMLANNASHSGNRVFLDARDWEAFCAANRAAIAKAEGRS